MSDELDPERLTSMAETVRVRLRERLEDGAPHVGSNKEWERLLGPIHWPTDPADRGPVT